MYVCKTILSQRGAFFSFLFMVYINSHYPKFILRYLTKYCFFSPIFTSRKRTWVYPISAVLFSIYKRSGSLFQTVSSSVGFSGSRYSVWFFNIPYTIFTRRLDIQISACCLFFPSSCFFWKYSRNTGCLAVPLGATCTI